MHWPDWETGPAWGKAYDALALSELRRTREEFIAAMRAAEQAHWRRVESERTSGAPLDLVSDGLRRLAIDASDGFQLKVMDAYARAIAGWSVVFPDARETLALLRERGYRLGLLSNTWWAADWHNADLAAHGLGGLLDELVYTSDLPRSKPHPSVFGEIAARLDVAATQCVMIGDRQIDDVSGAKGVGMRAIWRRNDSGFPTSDVAADATVDALAELPALLRSWGGR